MINIFTKFIHFNYKPSWACDSLPPPDQSFTVEEMCTNFDGLFARGTQRPPSYQFTINDRHLRGGGWRQSNRAGTAWHVMSEPP